MLRLKKNPENVNSFRGSTAWCFCPLSSHNSNMFGLFVRAETLGCRGLFLAFMEMLLFAVNLHLLLTEDIYKIYGNTPTD